MAKRIKIVFIVLISLSVMSAFAFFLRNAHLALLEPKGLIAFREKSVMLHALFLMALVALPTFGFLFYIMWKYRAGNANANHDANLNNNSRLQFFLWVIPSAIILLVGILNWRTTHELDPMRSLSSTTTPITIQVVALRWKWLFIYPEQHMATVNFVEFPVGTPINFELTADAPMNSFWIPELGGQMYAMAGMSTKLHLIADQPGEFKGRGAEISGVGFAGMNFVAKAVPEEEFNRWANSVHDNGRALGLAQYESLSQPKENNPIAYYSSVQEDLYNSVIGKYISPINVHESGTRGDININGSMRGMETGQ